PAWVPAALGASFVFDGTWSGAARAAAPPGSVAHEASRFLSQVALPVGVAVGVAPVSQADPEAGAAAIRAGQTTAFLTQLFKSVAGRARPNSGHTGLKGSFVLTDDAWQSFPSMATSTAFAVATSVAIVRPAWKEEAY